MRAVVWAGLVVLLAGCSEDGAAASAPPPPAAEAPVAVAGSAQLARAPASVTNGSLSAQMRAALAASADPRDQRAARLLASFDAAPPPVEAEPEDPSPLAGAPRIKMGTAPPPVERKPAAAPRTSSAVKPAASKPTASPPPAKPRATLEGVRMSSTRKGASLSLKGSGGLVVGVASQPQSGIVRLVMDAEASTSALRARPKVTGGRITGVRRTGKSVFVTLALDPGWSLGGIVRTRGGARVDLKRP